MYAALPEFPWHDQILLIFQRLWSVHTSPARLRPASLQDQLASDLGVHYSYINCRTLTFNRWSCSITAGLGDYTTPGNGGSREQRTVAGFLCFFTRKWIPNRPSPDTTCLALPVCRPRQTPSQPPLAGTLGSPSWQCHGSCLGSTNLSNPVHAHLRGADAESGSDSGTPTEPGGRRLRAPVSGGS